MEIVNSAMTKLFDALLAPFSGLPPVFGLLFISFFSGIFLLKLFGLCSDQTKIKRIKNKIQAHILQIVLYKDDLGLSMQGVFKTLSANIFYLLHALLPLVILTIPCLLILAQLSIRYAYRPLKVGEQTMVRVKVAPGVPMEGLSLTAGKGVQVIDPPLKIQAQREAVWKIKALEAGVFSLTVRTGKGQYEKTLSVGAERSKLSVGRYKSGFGSLLHPGESPLKKSSEISEVSLKYPGIEHRFLFLDLNWLVLFFVISITGGLIFKDLLGVEA